MTNRKWKLAIHWVLLTMFFCVSGKLWAVNSAGFVKNIKGQVTIVRNGEKMDAVVGTELKSEDTVMTAANSAVGLILKDGTSISAGANAMLLLNKYAFDTSTQQGALDATIKKGTLAVISGKLAKTSREAVVYRSPNAILGVRGTTFLIEVGEDGTVK